MKVPFIDLDLQYKSIKNEVHQAITDVLESKKFIQGPYVDQFANNFCATHGGKYSVGCSNGTSAISIVFRALGIGSGDEVITTTNTFFATVEAIHEVGAEIVLCDSRPDTYGLDVEKLEELISDKTKAIVPVHLYGNPCEMDRIMALAKKYDLFVVEDCAQAHMARFASQAVGTFGDAATFSFYPGKNLGAYGDAGLILTKTKELKELCYMHINHGRIKKYEHDFLASNYRMDGIQAAILDVKLKYLDGWTQKRIAKAKMYDRLLKNEGFKVIEILPNAECVYHLYTVEVSNRDEVMKGLEKKNIETGIHYPIPMHLQPALKFLRHIKGDFPNAEKSCERILSLPIYAEIEEEQIEYVVKEFLQVAKK